MAQLSNLVEVTFELTSRLDSRTLHRANVLALLVFSDSIKNGISIALTVQSDWNIRMHTLEKCPSQA